MFRATTEYTIADQERMRAAQRYFQWQARIAGAELGRRVLEVGCGVGNFSDHLRDRDLVVGIDIDSDCISRWRERFSDRPHYRGLVIDDEFSGYPALSGFGFDSVACLNVLEHIEDHEGALKQMRELLPCGGRVVLLVPAFEALYGEIDVRLGHFRRYTRGSLSSVAESAGFLVRRLRYMNFVGFFAWWANAKIFRRTEQSPAQIAFFDNCIVPVLSRVEGRIPPPLGQSIFGVLKKR